MKVITINLSELHIKALQVLMDVGLYSSRSEAIRVAIRDFLQKELTFACVLKNDDLPIEKEKEDKSSEDRKRELIILIRKLEKEQRVQAIETY